MIFKRGFLNLLQIQTHGHGILKSSFFSLSVIVGVGSISRVLVILHKPSFEVPFL